MAQLIEVTVGRFGRAQGIKGEVNIVLRTDEPGRRFIPGAVLTLGAGPETVEIVTTRWHKGRLVVTLLGYPDRTAVEALNGQWLNAKVAAEERPADPDEYFDRQLVGLRVLDHAGVEVGHIAEVLHMPAQELLRIEGEGEDKLVPFVSALVPVVDMAGGFVQLANVGGLLGEEEE